MKGNRSLTAYLSGITEEMLQEERRQVLEADSGDIRKLAPVVEAVLSEGSLCVLGNDRNLARGGALLKEIKPLFGRGNEERG